jgi:hypothetical protein
VDHGQSGTKHSRPAMNRLMTAARVWKIDAILVWKIDRWGRSMPHFVASIQELRGLGVRFIAVTQNLDTDESNPTAKLMLNLLVAFSEFERELIVERTRAGLARARREGKRLGVPFKGRTRKVVMTAERNGYFFVLDRSPANTLSRGDLDCTIIALCLDDKGRPKRNPAKDATIPGSLVNGDVTNYPPPSFSPDSGFFYVPERNSLRISYLIDPDPRGSMGLGGTMGGGGVSYGSYIDAIDYRTGEVVWRHENEGSAGLLSTAGGLLFSGDGQNLVAYEGKTGKPLWHSRIGATGNAPETYMLDGKQYVLATGGDQLFAFVLNQ